MAYSDDLLEHAIFLADLNVPNGPKQVDLRRAVSAAYYSLFQLLTSEAAQNWKHDWHRTRFARIFDHKPMKDRSASFASKQRPSDPAKVAVLSKLKVVAENFVDLQQARNDADYDNSRVWSRTQAYEEILKAEVAIAAWASIREEDVAQDYLFDLLDSRRR